jgi:hypothetical protein
MANEPSLSELSNVPVDSSRGTGTPATIYDNRELGRLLNDNAQQKAHYDWQKYNMFLGNLKDTYKDLGEISKQPVLEEDMPALRTEMATIIKDISKDPQSFFGGGAKYGEIQGKIAQLQSKATESKGNKLFDEAHRQFFYRNPELETPENKATIENFRKQPLGARKPYQLTMPGLVDMDELAKTINANVKKEESYSRATPDNQFIEKGKSTVYDPQQFELLANAAYDQVDKRNIPIRETMQKRFQTLPPYLQQQIQEQYKGQKDPVKAWFVDDLKKRMLQDSETKDDLVPNPGYLDKEKLAVDKYKAESGRISANASASRAAKYAELTNKKVAAMDDTEKRTKGFWDGVVNRVTGASGVIPEGEDKGIEADIIWAGNLPRGYRFMGGVGSNGKPIELEPYKGRDGSEYYKTKYTSQDGKIVDRPFLNEKYNAFKKSGGSGGYDDYVKKLIKSGVIDLEVQGQTKSVGLDGKTITYTPSVANFETASQAARSINNKINTKGEEPIFGEEDQQPE